ncbi:MAG: beta-lactamase family protein [Actinomycetota bacterium]|nr:beta-lactamase family protein [Actinomycetota bacterium]
MDALARGPCAAYVKLYGGQQSAGRVAVPARRESPDRRHADNADHSRRSLWVRSNWSTQEGFVSATHCLSDPLSRWEPNVPRQIVDMAIAQGPHSAPGQIYYSDTNYVILGKIVHEVTGQPIGKVITEQILKPLNLTHTSFPDSAGRPEPATVGYVIQGGQTKVAPRLRPSALGAAGVMISTVGDLKVWAKALATGALLSPTTAQARLHFLPLTTFPPLQGSGVSAAVPAGYGLGLANLGGLLGHNGVVPGYEADMWYSPSSDATFVVLLNGEIITSAGLHQVSDAMVVSMSQIVLPADAITTVG